MSLFQITIVRYLRVPLLTLPPDVHKVLIPVRWNKENWLSRRAQAALVAIDSMPPRNLVPRNRAFLKQIVDTGKLPPMFYKADYDISAVNTLFRTGMLDLLRIDQFLPLLGNNPHEIQNTVGFCIEDLTIAQHNHIVDGCFVPYGNPLTALVRYAAVVVQKGKVDTMFNPSTFRIESPQVRSIPYTNDEYTCFRLGKLYNRCVADEITLTPFYGVFHVERKGHPNTLLQWVTDLNRKYPAITDGMFSFVFIAGGDVPSVDTVLLVPDVVAAQLSALNNPLLTIIQL